MIMNDTFKELFGPIQAEQGLKDRTKAFLAEKTQDYGRAAPRKYRRYVRAAACACLLLAVLGGRWLYFTPTAEISIDIDPSVELGINRFDQVIFVNGMNEDGMDLSDAVDIRYKNYVEAVERIVCHDSITSLLSGGEVMTITVVGPDGQRAADILSGVAACTAGQSNTYCYFARPEDVAAAHAAGLSHGKYRAFLELQLLDPDVTCEAVQGMTMREIRESIESLSPGGDGAASCDDGGAGHHGQGDGHGNGWRNGRTGP